MTKEALFIEAVKSCEFETGQFKDDLEVGFDCVIIPVQYLEEVLRRYDAAMRGATPVGKRWRRP